MHDAAIRRGWDDSVLAKFKDDEWDASRITFDLTDEAVVDLAARIAWPAGTAERIEVHSLTSTAGYGGYKLYSSMGLQAAFAELGLVSKTVSLADFRSYKFDLAVGAHNPAVADRSGGTGVTGHSAASKRLRKPASKPTPVVPASPKPAESPASKRMRKA
jgi:hypothetical protein